jgi:hypothetical protein
MIVIVTAPAFGLGVGRDVGSGRGGCEHAAAATTHTAQRVHVIRAMYSNGRALRRRRRLAISRSISRDVSGAPTRMGATLRNMPVWQERSSAVETSRAE